MTVRLKLGRWVLYPWFVALYPIIYLYSLNTVLVDDGEVLQSVVVTAALTAVLFGLVCWALSDVHAGGFATAIVAAIFFSYGHLYNVIFVIPAGRDLLAPVLLLVGAVVIGSSLKFRALLATLTPYFNVIFFVLLIFPVWSVSGYILRTFADEMPVAAIENLAQATFDANRELPDIYYIILDAYPRADWLLQHGDFDNSAFLDALTDRGFYVAEESRSNYGLTATSIASALNMRYLDDLAEIREGRESVSHAYPLMLDNAVAKELKREGYSYIQVASGFVPQASTLADLNVDFAPGGTLYFSGKDVLNEQPSFERRFWPFLLDTTFLRLVVDESDFSNPKQPYRWEAPERVGLSLGEVGNIATFEEPTFTFFHFLKPHEPMLFDREGNLVSDDPFDPELYLYNTEETEHRFLDQLVYTNTLVLQLVDEILAASDVPPLIILQGDHGLRFGRIDDIAGLGASNPFEILNAYYLPAGGERRLYPTITPVNSFRVILDHYFGRDLGLLEDRSFASPQGYGQPFAFIEVER